MEVFTLMSKCAVFHSQKVQCNKKLWGTQERWNQTWVHTKQSNKCKTSSTDFLRRRMKEDILWFDRCCHVRLVLDQCTVCEHTHGSVTVVWQSADISGGIPEPPHPLFPQAFWQRARISVTGEPRAVALKPHRQSWHRLCDWDTSSICCRHFSRFIPLYLLFRTILKSAAADSKMDEESLCNCKSMWLWSEELRDSPWFSLSMQILKPCGPPRTFARGLIILHAVASDIRHSSLFHTDYIKDMWWIFFETVTSFGTFKIVELQSSYCSEMQEQCLCLNLYLSNCITKYELVHYCPTQTNNNHDRIQNIAVSNVNDFAFYA